MDLARLPVTLAQFTTDDGWRLDAALHEPASPRPGRTGVVLLHGKAGNCYTGPSRFLAAGLCEAGYYALALNQRTHDLGYTRADREAPHGTFNHEMGGAAWEILAHGHLDVRAAVGFLRAEGCSRVVLLGHSSGGFYAADFANHDPDIAAFVFVSPLLTNRTALRSWFHDEVSEQVAYSNARAMIAQGDGDRLIPLPTWYYAISAASLVDRMDERRGWFDDAMAKTRAPVLMLCGSQETRVEDWRRALERMPSDHKEFEVIPGAEHMFLGHEAAATAAVTGFLERVLA